MSPRCLVTGPSGFVGSHLVEALLARGHAVRCLVRKTSSLSFLRDERIELAFGDVTDADSLPAAVAGCDYVYHAAGLVKARRESDFFTVNAQGTASLLRAWAEAGPNPPTPFPAGEGGVGTTAAAPAGEGSEGAGDRSPLPLGGRGAGGVRSDSRFVLVSSLAAVGAPTSDAPLCEDTPPRPLTPYGKSKRLAEEIAAAWSGRLPITIVRPPAVYGPRDRETLAAFQIIARGLSPVPTRDQRISLVHVRDLVAGIVLAAESPAGVGRTYLLAGAEDVTLAGLSRGIAAALGRRPLTLALPPASFALAGELNCRVANALGRSAIFDRNKGVELAQRHWVCDSARARSEIGYAPKIPLAEGLRETADWYRQAGWL